MRSAVLFGLWTAVDPGLTLQPLDSIVQGHLLPATEERVAFPPVDPHLTRLVGRRDEQAQPDREELDVEQIDLDFARDDDALVEDALEDVGELSRLRSGHPRLWEPTRLSSRRAHETSSTWERT